MKYGSGRLALLMCLAGTVSAAELEAQIQWADLTQMSIGVPGVVADNLVSNGALVKAGQPLLVLMRNDLTLAHKAAEEAQKAAAMALAEAVRELERTQELYDRTVLSDHELMKVKIAHQQAQAEAVSADSQLAAAALALQWARIVAPFDARVVQVNVNANENLLLNDSLKPQLLVARSDKVWLQTQISGLQARKLIPEQKMSVTVAGKKQAAVLEQLRWQSGKTPQWLLSVSTEGDFQQLAGEKAVISLP